MSSIVVTVHVAQSLDGRLSLRGRSTALSTGEGRHAAHMARAEHDAVLVGMNTVRVDDPRLTVRLCPGSDPLRVVLASRLDVPTKARVLDRNSNGRVLVIGAMGQATEAAKAVLLDLGAEVAIVESTPEGMVRLDRALEVLAQRGVKTLLVEGGARVLTSFFQARRVDRIGIEIAMTFLGEPNTTTLGALGIDGLERAPTLENIVVDRLGSSVFVRGDVKDSDTT